MGRTYLTYDETIRLESCSKDPIGYEGSPSNLYAWFGRMTLSDPLGLSCSLQPCFERCEADFNVGRDLAAYTACTQRCVEVARNFNEWYEEQQRLGRPRSYGTLPTCPCNISCKKTICVSAGVGAPGIPHEIFCAPEGWYFPVLQWTYLPIYHPGAYRDMRSNEGPPYVQCTYDASGQLITRGTGIGTVDVEPAGTLRHLVHDVWPVDWVIHLEGGTFADGCWFRRYRRMRPSTTGRCADNPPLRFDYHTNVPPVWRI